LNPHASRRQNLNLMRLPIPPHPHILGVGIRRSEAGKVKYFIYIIQIVIPESRILTPEIYLYPLVIERQFYYIRIKYQAEVIKIKSISIFYALYLLFILIKYRKNDDKYNRYAK
jgi:hypothetical protein